MYNENEINLRDRVTLEYAVGKSPQASLGHIKNINLEIRNIVLLV